MSGGGDVLQILSQVQSLPTGLHWFCPRQAIDDPGIYFDEDIYTQTGQLPQDRPERHLKRVEEAHARRDLLLEAFEIFAYDSSQAETPQKYIEKALEEQLGRCDICVREFHRSRRRLKQQLMSEHDKQDVASFLQKFDSLNVRRIENGLRDATADLDKVDPSQRGIRSLSAKGMHAIFEALSCKPFHSNEHELNDHFDYFFATLQTNKALKLGSFSPAMAWFLFQNNRPRLQWASREWTRIKRNLLPIEFEDVVQDALVAAMARVQLDCLEKEFLLKFWEGARLMAAKMDQTIITGSLRSMEAPDIEADICRLAYNHLQVDSDAFMPLLGTMKHVLETSSTDFWDALGTISHTAWISEFFASKALRRLIGQAAVERYGESPTLDSLFSWIVPFMTSIRPANRPPAAKAILGQLMGKYQTESFPSIVNTYTALIGLQTLSTTLQGLNTLNATENHLLSSEALALTVENLRTIGLYAKSHAVEPKLAIEVFREAIHLDCSCFAAGVRKIASNPAANERPWSPHFALLRRGAASLDYGNMRLAKGLLLASRPLGGLEEFVSKQPGRLSQAQTSANSTLQGFSSPICDILDVIGEFASSDVRTLFDDHESALSVSLLLFDSDQAVRSSALELVKNLSGRTTRRDALSHLLSKNYSVVLRGMTLAMTAIIQKETFTPASSALRFLTDVLEAMFNQQDGQLRSSTLSNTDQKATYAWWQVTWKLLKMMFNQTEAWNSAGHDKQTLMDFCRDAMDFADRFFDQFGVLKGALGTGDGKADDEGVDDLGRRLIEAPKDATSEIMKWLKLRDDFLVSKSSALVCKLLTRLKDYDEQVEEKSLEWLVTIITGTSKSTLTPQQMAELSRALETHAGMVFDAEEAERPHPVHDPKKGAIDLERWASKAGESSQSRRKDASASTLATASPTYEKLKQAGGIKLPGRPAPQPAIPRKPPVNTSDFKKKREQEMAERKRRDKLAITQHKNRVGAPASVVGEGSGARGLGVQGKEHDTGSDAPDMYVDSASDDESDDAMDDELFGGAQTVKKPSRPAGLSKEQSEALQRQRQGPVKKQRVQRSHRDMRARLAPDLSPLHKTILNWEYFHDGAFPPGSSANDYVAVLSKFRDAYNYQHTFQPLLVLEAWNGFLKAREENNARPYEVKVVLRSSVDAFLEISSTMSHNDVKEISEGDIVLLSKARDPSSSPGDPHCLSRVAKLNRKKAYVEVLYRAMPGTAIAPHLAGGETLYGLKITSVVPLEREYGALLGLQFYDLCDEITQARPSPLLNYADDMLSPPMRNYGVNKAQAKAIKSALDNDAFTLIQGPPGSGKTKTVVALVGALLTDTLKMAGSAISNPRAAGGNQPASGGPKKMLVCAPSNAAVDELVMRFKEGVKTTSGEARKVSIVRLGRSDAINVNVQDVTLDELVSRRLNITSEKDNKKSSETQKIMMEHKQVSEDLRAMRQKVDEAERNGGITKELNDDFAAMRRKKAHLSEKVDTAKDSEGHQNRQADINRRKAQQEVLDGADIICATLSGSGHDTFQTLNIEFETVVVDEAAQCVELSCLIPLKYGCAKCVLVGDPQQLPPTVFSKEAARFRYEQSLFVRMQANSPKDVHLLDTQYRMHPEISTFPSKAFYDSRLLDGNGMAALRSRPWHGTQLLSPYRFFDVQGQHQSAPRGHSLINTAEINIALQLYKRLTTDFRSYDFHGKIGIITPYKSQLRELREQFKRQYGPDIIDNVEFNTIDAFQGRESEVIIFSCVRASPAGGIGFLQDIRRMNVGLTRAMSSLWVLGNSQSLVKGEFWRKLVEHSQTSDRYTEGDLQEMLRNPLQVVKKITDGSSSTGDRRTSHSSGIPSRRDGVSTTSSSHPKPASKTLAREQDKAAPSKPQPPSAPRQPAPPTTAKPPHDAMGQSGKHHAPQNPPPPKRKHSSDSDVEMTDAPAPKKPTPAANRPPSTPAPTAAAAAAAAPEAKQPREGLSKPSNMDSKPKTSTGSTAAPARSRPPAKRPDSLFIKKKPRPGF